jgi:hypothetical protein
MGAGYDFIFYIIKGDFMETVQDLYGKLVEIIMEGSGESKIFARDPISGELWRLDDIDTDIDNNGERIVIII